MKKIIFTRASRTYTISELMEYAIISAVENKKHVLVVDDESRVLRFINISLSQAGYEVTTTTSGEEALQLVKSEKPDIVLLDLLMVPMSGFDVLNELRVFSQVPVIIVTARNFTAEQVVEIRANDFVAKPFKPEELIKKLKELLSGRKPEDNRGS